MSKHGQLYNEWLTHNTMDRYMSDHKDRMEHDTEIEEVNYETRDYDGIRWIRYDHYEHALHHQLQKATGKAYTKGRSDEAKTCTGCQGRCEEQLQKAREEERQNAYAHADIVRRRMTLEVVEGIKEHYDLSGYIDGVIESLDHSELDQDSSNTN